MYPLLWPALCLAAGIFLQSWLHIAPAVSLTAALAALACFAAASRAGRERLSFYLLLVAFLSIGALRGGLQRLQAEPPFQDGYLRATVDVVEDPVAGRSGIHVLCRAVSLERGGDKRVWKGSLRIFLPDDASSVAWGDRLLVGGRLWKGSGGNWLMSVQEFDREAGGGSGRGGRALHSLRDRLLTVGRKTLAPREAGLLSAMTLGDRSGLDRTLNDAFSRTGTLHILSVSGLHVAFILAAVLGLLRWLGLDRRRSALVAGATLIVYVLLVGGQPCVLRSAVMGLAALTATAFGRRVSPLNGLSLAAICLLLYDPAALAAPGFQLSFAAVLGIIVLSPAVEAWFDFLPRRAGQALAVSMGAQLVTAPIIAWHFGIFSPLAPLANLVVVPLVGPAVPLGLAADIVGNLCLPLAQGINLITQGLLYISSEAVLLLDKLPGMSTTVQTPLPAFGLLAAALTAAVYGRERRPVRRAAAAALLLSLAAAMLIPVASRVKGSFDHRLKVTFLDVGQGDATLVRLPGGECILVDGGPKPLAGRLKAMGVKRLRAVILTHAHHDHVGGLPSVLRELRVDEVLAPGGQGHASSAYREFLEEIKERKIKTVKLDEGFDRTMDGVRLEVLHPMFGEDRSGKSLNNTSVVCRLTYGGASFLLTGDIEEEEEREILAGGRNIAARVLKVAHHGSRMSSSTSFLRRVRPEVAVISVGRGNDYGHPHQDTLKRLERAGAMVLRTDRQGTITVSTDGKNLSLRSEHRIDRRGGP